MLIIFGKNPNYQKEIESLQLTLSSFFWNDQESKIGNFAKLPLMNQESLIRFFFYFNSYSESLIKSISKAFSTSNVEIQVINLLIEILRLRKESIGTNLHTSLLISVLCSQPEPEILSEILVSFSSINAYQNIHNFIGNLLKKEITTYNLHFSLLSLVERIVILNHELSEELLETISKSLIHFFVKSLTEKKGLLLCESILMNPKIFLKFLKHVQKNESFLDILLEICKFTKVNFTKEFFGLSKEINVRIIFL